MSLKKKFLKSKPVCKVTFRVSQEQAPEAKNVCIVGDFNDWDKEATPLKALKSGDFKTTLDLDTEKEYAFRYLIDGKLWANEDEADAQVNNGVTNDLNSLIKL